MRENDAKRNGLSGDSKTDDVPEVSVPVVLRDFSKPSDNTKKTYPIYVRLIFRYFIESSREVEVFREKKVSNYLAEYLVELR